MKKMRFLLLIILIPGLFLPACKNSDNKLTEAEAQDGWTLLFDGKTLNGWRDFKSEGQSVINAPWKVENGTIASLGTGSDSTGYIVSTKEYENFIVSFDWKISDGGNSGFLYHVVERPEYKVPYVTGPEYQLLDDFGFKGALEPWQKAGADYAMYVPDTTKKQLKKAGQWNNSKIIFDNGMVEYWLNGQKIVGFEAWTDDWFARKSAGKWDFAPEYGLARSGVIALQDHGYKIWFKNMKIKELPRKPKEETLFNGTDLKGWDVYGTEKWYVQDGELVCESGPDKEYGYLGTRKYYNDFEVTVDFKQISNGNSGIFFRSYIKTGVNISGWQVEVAPPGNDTGGIYESYGRGWIAQIPDDKENILKMGDWNTMKIRVQGDNVKTWLNGEKMTDLTDAGIGKGKGRIMLQIHSGGGIKVVWKNIKLTEL
jgi:hypothetical protein